MRRGWVKSSLSWVYSRITDESLWSRSPAQVAPMSPLKPGTQGHRSKCAHSPARAPGLSWRSSRNQKTTSTADRRGPGGTPRHVETDLGTVVAVNQHVDGSALSWYILVDTRGGEAYRLTVAGKKVLTQHWWGNTVMLIRKGAEADLHGTRGER